MPDNLFGLIALQQFSTFVPTQNIAVPVKHIDGIVLNAFNHQAKRLFAFAQLFDATFNTRIQLTIELKELFLGTLPFTDFPVDNNKRKHQQ